MECRKSQRLHWNHPSGDWRALTRFLLGSLKSFLLPAQCSSCLTALLQRGSKLLVLRFRLSLELHNYIFLIFYQLKNPTTLQCHCTDYRIFFALQQNLKSTLPEDHFLLLFNTGQEESRHPKDHNSCGEAYMWPLGRDGCGSDSKLWELQAGLSLPESS